MVIVVQRVGYFMMLNLIHANNVLKRYYEMVLWWAIFVSVEVFL